jgi:hypothetical protein
MAIPFKGNVRSSLVLRASTVMTAGGGRGRDRDGAGDADQGALDHAWQLHDHLDHSLRVKPNAGAVWTVLADSIRPGGEREVMVADLLEPAIRDLDHLGADGLDHLSARRCSRQSTASSRRAFDAADLKDAKALLDELSASDRNPSREGGWAR